MNRVNNGKSGRFFNRSRHSSLVMMATIAAGTISCFYLMASSTGLSRVLFLDEEINSFQNFRSSKVPKKLHFMILGQDPPEYMLEMVRFNEKHVAKFDPEFTTKIWRNEDVEKLVEDQDDPELSQAWEYVKQDKRGGKLAKMADFIRPLILYVEGGVYLDADMIPCGGLSFMVDEPGVVTYPFTYAKHHSNELNGAASSAPKGHRLMKLAMEYFVSKGHALATEHNLDAAGPKAMAIVADMYIDELGLNDELDGVTLPRFHIEEENMYKDLPDDAPELANKHHHGFARIADIKYTNGGSYNDLFHLSFGTWFHTSGDNRVCTEEPKEVVPFLEWFCKPKNRAARITFDDCGVINKE